MSISPLSAALAQGAKYATAYAKAVNQNGNVNQKKLNAADGGSVANGRSGIVTGYAAEFMVGDRIPPSQMDAAAQQFAATPDSPAKTFAVVASRYKNAGGNYDNGKLKAILTKAGAADLANQPGVGKKDVQTLHAVYQALQQGKVQLSDIFDPSVNGGKGAVKDPAKYQNAIDAVQQGDITSSIQDGKKAQGNRGATSATPGGAPAGATAPRAAGAPTTLATPPAAAGDVADPMTQIMLLLQQLQQLLQQYMQQSGGGASLFKDSLANTGQAATATPAPAKPATSAVGGGGY